jgi:hypothetical protein
MNNDKSYFNPISCFTLGFTFILTPNPDKPEQIATKAPRHKAKSLVNIHLCVFVSWWRKCFFTKCKESTIKTLIDLTS